MPAAPAPAVAFDRVSKTYGTTVALRDLTLTIQPGEFFSLLGPSGCGKTTTLRLLAGLEEADPGGVIRIHGDDCTRHRPYERPLAMVFQQYALFPHLSVEANVAFGLVERRVPRADIGPRVRQALELVRLDPTSFARRMPASLSGGQRQRVALARALVLEPRLLLLDEPLGAIDRKLRREMQLELTALNRRLGITFLFVTHDQDEALTMSDRIAVMDHARVVQVGTPAEVYERPRTRFVAEFMGSANFITLPDTPRARTVAVRPERLGLEPQGMTFPDIPAVRGVVASVLYLGDALQVVVLGHDGARYMAAIPNDRARHGKIGWQPGDLVTLRWHPDDAHILEDDA